MIGFAPVPQNSRVATAPAGGGAPVGALPWHAGQGERDAVRSPVWGLLDLARRLAATARRLTAFASARHESVADEQAATLPRPLSAAEALRFRQTMLPHLDAAYTLARYLARDADAAQDIVQDAYLRAYRGFAEFRGMNGRAWLLAIVRNCHLTWRDQLRRDAQRRAPQPAPTDEDTDVVDPVHLLADGETPETILLRQSEANAVRTLLEHLPEPLREVLVLRELDDLSYREIAEVAGVPVGTVMSRLSRARRQFADLWARAAGGGSTP